MKRTIIAILFTVQIMSIGIPLTIGKERCMITYSIGDSETIKLDMNFPEVTGQLPNEAYVVSWRNTQTQQSNIERIQKGPFKKELELQLHIIYEVCFWFETKRPIVETVNIDYAASSLFDIKHDAIKVPDTLLKSEDLERTFQNADGIMTHIDYFKQVQTARNTENQRVFQENAAMNDKMIKISIIELLIIVGAGLYQFWALRGFLVDKQYV